MRKVHVILVALGLAAAPTAGGIRVSLRAAGALDEAVFPFRPAVLRIERAAPEEGRLIRAVALRCSEGGPTIVVPAAIPRETTQDLTVPLPAVSVRQTYTVELLAADEPGGPVIEDFAVPIDWPAECVTAAAFINPDAYRPWEFDLPAWPARLVRGVFMAAFLCSCALAGALLIGPGAIRAAAAATLVCAAVIVLWQVLRPQQIVVEKTGPAARLTVLTSRRTTRWTHPEAKWAPVYYSRRQMERDTMVIDAARGVTVRLEPSEVRLLMRCRG